MTSFEFAIIYILITALWLLLSWLFCSLVDYITEQVKKHNSKAIHNGKVSKVA
jgi:hypothetical protein